MVAVLTWRAPPRPSLTDWSAKDARLFVILVLSAVLTAACSAPQPAESVAPVALSVGISDDGSTFGVPKGALVVLSLPADYVWALDTPAESGIEIVEKPKPTDPLARWLLRMSTSRVVQVRVIGTPLCAAGTLPCPPARRFEATFDVR